MESLPLQMIEASCVSRAMVAEAAAAPTWRELRSFFEGLDLSHSSFISINWDTVIERNLAEIHEVQSIEYGCEAIAAEFPRNGNVVVRRHVPETTSTVSVIKIHGSVNWLYCDNCRNVYWFKAKEAFNIANQL